MLSTAAFNALLKILEEPPAHLIFILATTELHKVPATILSRCQRFAFRRLRVQDIADRLQYVAQAEGMRLETEAAQLLARLADGALRDALSLLDQCGASGGVIDSNRVLDVLGLAGNTQTLQLMECLAYRDVQAALLWLDKLYAGGKDVSALLGELSSLTRDILIRMTAPQGGASLLSGAYDLTTLNQLAGEFNASRLIYMTTQLQNTLAGLPMSTNRRTDAELCLMRLCDESLCGDVTALHARLARLEEGGVPATRASASPVRVQRVVSKPEPSVPVVQEECLPWEASAPIESTPMWMDAPPVLDNADVPPPYGEPLELSAPTPEPVTAPVPEMKTEQQPKQNAGGDSNVWWTLIEKYKDRVSPMYQFMLDDACGIMEGEALMVHCGDDLTKDSLDCPAVIEALEGVTSDYLKHAVKVRFVIGKPAMESSGEDRLEALIRAGSKFENFIVK